MIRCHSFPLAVCNHRGRSRCSPADLSGERRDAVGPPHPSIAFVICFSAAQGVRRVATPARSAGPFPSEVAGFAPFGIKDINGTLFVSYAKQKPPDNHDDQEGPGNGFVDEFDTNGHFIKRFASGTAAGGTLTQLNSPIGMAVAPANYGPDGRFSNALLIGNFGDSHVSAFDIHTGEFLGQLSDDGQPLILNGGFQHGPNDKGLWGIGFGNGHNGADPNTLFFAAGINDENDGAFGKVQFVQEHHDRDGSPAVGVALDGLFALLGDAGAAHQNGVLNQTLDLRDSAAGRQAVAVVSTGGTVSAQPSEQQPLIPAREATPVAVDGLFSGQFGNLF